MMSKAFANLILALALSFPLSAADCLLHGVQYLETGSDRSDMTAADFNHDGFPDVALTGTASGVLRVYLNQGDGSLVLSDEKKISPAPLLVASGDFNGDASADLAVVTKNSILILLGDGKGKFTVARLIQVQSVIAIAAGDWNSDSIADLAVLRRSGTESVVTVYRNTRASTEVSQTLPVKSGTDLIAARLGSGHALDLVASSDRGTITVFKGSGTGVFQEMATAQAVAGAAHVVSGFVDGDNRIDLVVSGTNGDLAVLLGQTETEFHRIQLSTGSEIQGLALGDWNDDRLADLLLIHRNSRASIYSGDGQGRFLFARGFAYGLFTGRLLVADLNRDGKDDFIAAERGDAGVFLRNGKNAFAIGARTILNQGGNLFAGDFDGDGNADLLISGSNGTILLRGKGNGTFYPPQPSGLPQLGYGSVADFNGDGKFDLAGFDRLKLKAWLSSDAVEFNETTSVPLYTDPPVQTLDVNGDGMLDIALVTFNALFVFPGSGNGLFSRTTPIFLGYQYSGTLADLNGDGIPDAATVESGDGVKQLGIYLGGPNLTFTKFSKRPLEGCPGSISAGDANGDGKMDLVVGSTCGDPVRLFLGDGHGGFSEMKKVKLGGGSSHPFFADLNGDGKAEIVSLSEALAKISVALAPDFTDSRILGPFYWDHVAVADFDHDGHPDLAVSSYNSTAVFLSCH